MKRTISGLVVVAFLLVGVTLVGFSWLGNNPGTVAAAQDETPPSTVVPAGVVILSKDNQDPKYKNTEVSFNHKTHATLNYSPDGKSKIGCAECHHTDQPPNLLQPPLTTSKRAELLTDKTLAPPVAAGVAGVKTCRSCHFQLGEDDENLPSVTYPGKTRPTRLPNDIAYHTNCNNCHDAVLKMRPDTKDRVAGTNDCAKCHTPAGSGGMPATTGSPAATPAASPAATPVSSPPGIPDSIPKATPAPTPKHPSR